ncbi:MAG: protein kinase [Kofleriaceae bacterium]
MSLAIEDTQPPARVCPDENQLVLLVEGAVDASVRGELEHHLDRCQRCSSVLGELAGIEPHLVEDYPQLQAIDPEHFVIGKEIARGGMGRILTARDRRLGRSIAIKELIGETVELRARFEREARITANLQHPGIVSIHEAGTWPSGEPFYVMKLVAGRSLDKVIAERTELEDRLGLVPNLIAVVDALAYAHSVGVIHRDLKPANVLVGEFGETVVIDWGLAKDLKDDDAAPELSVGPYRATGADPIATVAGTVLGTPGYMPPEQARGEVVGERADVYALGAMLYHVLAGEPPFVGNTSREIVERVLAGPPPAVGQRVPSTPPDLAAIVSKAMARDPGERYPTAKQLADDLKRFQTGQLVGARQYSSWQLVRRWMRKHRLPMTVAAVAAVALIVGGVVSVTNMAREQQRTEAQRVRAEASRLKAEDLTTFMLDDLKSKLQEVGRLDLLEVIANKASTYYDEHDPPTDDEALDNRARVRQTLAQVRREQGDTAAALVQYRDALQLNETLATRHPGNTTIQSNVMKSHSQLGDVLMAQGDLPGARASYDAALAIAQRVAADQPQVAEFQRYLAMCQSSIGDVLVEQGDVATALVQYEAALAITKSLVNRDPNESMDQRGLSFCYAKVAEAKLQIGKIAEAGDHHRAALAVDVALSAKEPQNIGLRSDLAGSYMTVGDAEVEEGKIVDALGRYRSASALFAQLVVHDPTNADWQRLAAGCRQKIGYALQHQGKTAEAIAEHRAAIEMFKALAAADPTNTRRTHELGLGYASLGAALFEQSEPARALAAFEAARATFQTLADGSSPTTDMLSDLATVNERIGDILASRGDRGAALNSYQTMRVMLEKLSAEDPANGRRQRNLAVAVFKVGEVLLAERKPADALVSFERALAIAEKLAAGDPSGTKYQADVAEYQLRIGDALVMRRDRAGAARRYQTALAIMQRLIALDPNNPEWAKLTAELARKAGRAAPN